MSEIGAISYGAACIAFAGLAMLAAVANLTIREGRAFVGASIATALWAALLSLSHAGSPVPDLFVLLAEILRHGTWLWFLLLLAPTPHPRRLRVGLLVLLAGWAVAAFLIPDGDAVLARGGLLAALTGLILLEQLHRNVTAAARRDLRFVAIGIGGLFAYDLFLFAQGELFRAIDPESWRARGIVNALLVPFLLVGARRIPHARLELFISRQFTLYTTAMLAAGVYLFLMAGVGFLVREYGGRWGEVARYAFLAGALGVLAALFGSSTVRQRINVFLSKHFYRGKYDYRLEWLRFIRTLSAADGTEVPVAAVQSVAQILGSPGGMLFRPADASRAFGPVAVWPAGSGIAREEYLVEADAPMLSFMQSRRWIIDLREYEGSPELYGGVTLPGWLTEDPRWRLVSPIFLGDRLIGFFVLLDPPATFRLTYEDRDLLNTAGQHVATLLAQQDADRRVAELSQFEAYNRLTAFVMHDLKNSAAQLTLLVRNAVRHKHNPEFIDDAVSTIAHTSDRITRLIENLRRESPAATVQPVDLQVAVGAAVERCAGRAPEPVLERIVTEPCMVSADPERLVAAVEHVIRNAQEAAGDHGRVSVALERTERRARITIADSGPGMDPEFVRTRLFRPFDTTKGGHGMGLGAYQARELARSVGGDVAIDTAPGAGTRFSFDLPLVT